MKIETKENKNVKTSIRQLVEGQTVYRLSYINKYLIKYFLNTFIQVFRYQSSYITYTLINKQCDAFCIGMHQTHMFQRKFKKYFKFTELNSQSAAYFGRKPNKHIHSFNVRDK